MSKKENKELTFTAARSVNRASIERLANSKESNYVGGFHVQPSMQSKKKPSINAYKMKDFTFG